MNARDFLRERARLERRAGNRSAFFRRAMARLVSQSGAVAVRAADGHLMAYALPDGSFACVKHRYRDEVAARVELVRIIRDSRTQRVPVRHYRCELCDGWHLTSQAK